MFNKLSPKQIVNICLILFLLIFIAQNIDNIPVQLLFFTFQIPLIVIILAVFFIGFYTAKIFEKKKE
jgi:uncharacterized integral membrane protein